jgi:thiamine-monophosphate kinase
MLFDPLAHTVGVYNRIAKSYASKWFDSTDLQELIDRFVSSLPNSGSVLDAGCGSGRDVRYLSQKLCRGIPIDCVGVDLSHGLIREARARVPDNIFRIMDVRQLQYPDSLFDGVMCFGVLNHLFEEDLFDALASFARVLRSGGLLAATVKLGRDHEIDQYGRIIRYYDEARFISYLREFGFTIGYQNRERREDGVEWLQLVAENKTKNDAFDANCFFCMPWLFPQNRTKRLPVAGSILWGDSDLFCTVDSAPLVDGHLLLITNQHFHSFMSSDVRSYKISQHKEFASSLLHRVYGVKPVFLEHGTIPNLENENSCIEHAHLHALPLSRGIKTLIESSLGPIHEYYDDDQVRTTMADREYILYEDKTGHLFVKSDGLGQLQSQFFRIIVGTFLGRTEVKWASALENKEVRQSYKNTLDALVPALDEIQLALPIVSKVTESRKTKLFGKYPLGPDAEEDGDAIRRIRQKIDQTLTLGELGEDKITKTIIYEAFERNIRGKVLGDDAAVIDLSGDIKSIVVTIDPCPRPIIFDFIEVNYRYYGWLSLIISLSDIAAMGAEPLGALISCEMPYDTTAGQFLDLLDGVGKASDRYYCRIVGGNIKDTPQFNVTTTVFGTTKNRRPLRRTGAQSGQTLFAIGNMGFFWAGILRMKLNLVLPREMHNILEDSLRFPEPNVWAGIELSKSGVVGACMDASDGPTGCFYEIAAVNGLDIVIDTSGLRPAPAVFEVARQLDIDPKVLMLTWGNWELIFTANESELRNRLAGHPILNELIVLGQVTSGKGKVYLDKVRGGTQLPDLSSKRFSAKSSFTHGIDGYMSELFKIKL